MHQTYATSSVLKRKSHIQSIRESLRGIPMLKTRSAYLLSNNLKTSDRDNEESQNNEKEGTTVSPQSDLNINKTSRFIYQNSFFQKYNLLEKIGSGCNASVYKCLKKSNQRFYAVKKIKIQKQHVSQLKQNFISLKNLKHPLISAYKEIFFDCHQRFCFLVTEYYPFPDLSEVTVKSQKELKAIIESLVRVLSYLHTHNICHRDIKPQNILYNEKDGKIKLVDFGISKKTFLRGVRRDMLTIIGTNFYFAPEIYLGGGYDERVDLWALGVTIFKLITGYTPFESEYHADTIANILKGEFNFNDVVWENYNTFAKDFISRLLKQKNQRMTLNQCEKHLWFQVEKEKTKKFRRLSSDYILISEDFRQQMKKYQEATPKEEGQPTIKSLSKIQLAKSKLNFYDFESSDDSDSQSSLGPINKYQKAL